MTGERISSCALARKLKIGEDTLNRHLKRSLQQFNKKISYPELPKSKKLIAIADAMIQQIENKRHSIYFILIRSHDSNEAYIAQPYYEEGSESYTGWFNAFEKLPKVVLKNIVAIVSDGHKGLVAVTKQNNWLMQRCHFHILAHLQGRRSKSQFSRHREVGIELFKLARDILENPNETEIQKSMIRLKEIEKQSSSPVLRRIIRGFLRNYQQFRTYLIYPELNLPKTSNSAESLISCVRNLLRKAKGFRTETSLKEWIEGLVKSKVKMKNNGSHQPN